MVLPIYWTKIRKTKKSTNHLLGMNWFRNAHYFDQNTMKQEMTELVLNQIKNSTIKFEQFQTHYRLYYKSKVCDPSNIIALIEKVSLDALQTASILKEDNVQYHKQSSWEVVEQDRENSRCEIIIKAFNT
jgi:2-hydroxychromene-2-carboxylate isomerase